HRDSGGGHPAAPAPQHEQGDGIAACGPDGPDLILAAGENRGSDRVHAERGVDGHEAAPVEPGTIEVVSRRGSGWDVVRTATRSGAACIVRVLGQMVPR